ncbi:MAG: chemotaxis-specific protein-glutamate methyltransferase CheB [Pseudomonadota bacterium]
MSIRVLVAEDSHVARELIVRILRSDSRIEVVGMASNGEEAVEAVIRLKPDVITMDINMPGIGGYEATRRILEIQPTPIVVVSSSVDPKETATTCDALEAGALAAVQKPMGPGHPAHEETARVLTQTVKLMSEVKVIRRWPRRLQENHITQSAVEPFKPLPIDIQIVAIGASTGGPQALQSILSVIPRDFPAPIVIVQHMAPGFMAGFAHSLTRSCGLPVRVASHAEALLPAHVYLAPDGFQMGVDKQGRIGLSNGVPEGGLRPSVSHLFRSVSKAYGRKAVGVILTGMGRDGAVELGLMRAAGAITIAQDKESSVVHGMPAEAIKINAAMYVFSLSQIAAALKSLINGSNPGIHNGR